MDEKGCAKAREDEVKMNVWFGYSEGSLREMRPTPKERD